MSVLVFGCTGGEGIKELVKNECTSKDYYESGELRAEWNYKDGKKEGIARIYTMRTVSLNMIKTLKQIDNRAVLTMEF